MSKLFALVFWQMCFRHRTHEDYEKGGGNLGEVRTQPFEAQSEVWRMGKPLQIFKGRSLQERAEKILAAVLTALLAGHISLH